MNIGHSSCTILLDDAQSTPTNPTSRLYKNPIAHIKANTPNEVEVALQDIEHYLNNHKFVVANFSYELGEHLQGLTPKKDSAPWAEIWVFDTVTKLSKSEVDTWIENKTSFNQMPSGFIASKETITPPEFEKCIEEIHELIRRGETYQVNYTYRIKGSIYGAPLALYQSLRKKQPGPFGAYIEKNDGWILSCSPEWFLRKEGSRLIAKPMKGTGKASEMSPSFLKNDPKNRAENLMIVDLLRNDLGKISIPGTIKVPDLFNVQQHGDVLQMTSTIESTVSEKLSLSELLKAIFPCGSVTGTPKKRTMEIIQTLETEPRGLYCGSIAWFDPSAKDKKLGDLGMSVVIRTLTIDQGRNCCMGIGAGITIDSDAKEEWQECQTKSNFLYQIKNEISLFETIRISEQSPQNIQLHLNRIQDSAHQLGIPFNLAMANQAIKKVCAQLNPNELYRMKLELAPDGQIKVSAAKTLEINQPMPLIWASDLFGGEAIMNSFSTLLNHKTTQRKIYDLAWQEAEKLGGFDAIFTNELGYVTEGGRSNIFIKKNSQWMTPPVNSGCLPGIMRQILLKDPQWSVVEKNITVDDVLSSEEVILTNALRGIIRITMGKN